MCRLIVAALVMASVLAPLSAAEASVWSLRIDGALGGFPINVPSQVTLPDPAGGITIITGGVPIIISHTSGSGSFGILINFAFQDASCNVTVSAGGSGPKMPTPSGGEIAQFPLTGNQNETCSGTGSRGAAGSRDTPITGTVTAQNNTGTTNSTLLQKIGRVEFKTPEGQQQLQPGQVVPSNTFVATAPDSATTFQHVDNSLTGLAANTHIAVGENRVDVVRGHVDRFVQPGQPSNVELHTGTTSRIVHTATDYSVDYSQTGTDGRAVITVRSGTVEVTNRRGQRTSVAAGQQETFNDSVPRVLLIIPSDQGAVIAGRVNTFTWTSFPGSANYLIEFTLSANGFAVPNATTVENPVFTLRLPLGSFTEGSGITSFNFTVPTGVVPSGTRVRYRIFTANSSGQVLPGATASDANSITVQ